MVWFDDDDLRRLAGGRSYQRGQGYLDAVGEIDDLPDGVVASVYGTEPYRVRLHRRRGRLSGECSCPYGQDGAFCKHCVAVGLTLLAEPATGLAGPPGEPATGLAGPAGEPATAPDTGPGGIPAAGPGRGRRDRGRSGHPPGTRRRAPDVPAYLATLDRAELIELLMRQAADDPVLHRRLSLRAAASGAADLAELGRWVDRLRPRGFLEYRESFEYAAKAADILATLDRLATDRPAQIGPLYRGLLRHLCAAAEVADDSAGAIGEVAVRAAEGYARACAADPPDPVELAGWLAGFQLEAGWPELAVADFAGALGPDGLAAYRARLAEAQQAVGSDPASPDPRRFVLRHLREEYARTIEGDVDALVALYAEDLSGPYPFLKIGQELRAAGRLAEAIDWVCRGLAGTDRGDGHLDDLLAQLYTEAGRDAEALDVRWRIFATGPDVDRHRMLLDAAERADALAETSDRALGLLRERAAAGGDQADPLVRILLAAGDSDGAWAAAREFGCSQPCLLAAAEARAGSHPADAVPVLAAAVELAVESRTRHGYATAARLLGQLGELYPSTGMDFAAYLADVKHRHRRKRSLLATLHGAGL